MPLKVFRVYSVDWRDDEPTEVSSLDAEDACTDWCELMESYSNFIDGYPRDHELRVVSEDGTETRFVVNTEFNASYWVMEKPSAPQDASQSGQEGRV